MSCIIMGTASQHLATAISKCRGKRPRCGCQEIRQRCQRGKLCLLRKEFKSGMNFIIMGTVSQHSAIAISKCRGKKPRCGCQGIKQRCCQWGKLHLLRQGHLGNRISHPLSRTESPLWCIAHHQKPSMPRSLHIAAAPTTGSLPSSKTTHDLERIYLGVAHSASCIRSGAPRITTALALSHTAMTPQSHHNSRNDQFTLQTENTSYGNQEPSHSFVEEAPNMHTASKYSYGFLVCP